MMIHNVEKLHKKIQENAKNIFDYNLIIDFERDLFNSISSYVKEKYNYQLRGLTKSHYQKLISDINLNLEDDKLINIAFDLYAMISRRTITMGYGRSIEKREIENEKILNFLQKLEDYILEFRRM